MYGYMDPSVSILAQGRSVSLTDITFAAMWV